MRRILAGIVIVVTMAGGAAAEPWAAAKTRWMPEV